MQKIPSSSDLEIHVFVVLHASEFVEEEFDSYEFVLVKVDGYHSSQGLRVVKDGVRHFVFVDHDPLHLLDVVVQDAVLIRVEQALERVEEAEVH